MTSIHQGYYFAYGSNLHQARLQARVPSAYFVCLGKLPGYQLRFNKVGLDHSGKGNIEATGRPEDWVWGAVFRMDLSDLPHLDRVESLGVGYQRQFLGVATPQGYLKTFTYLALLKNDRLCPFHWYKAYVVKGALDLNIPADYIQRIQTVQSVADPDIERCLHHRAQLNR